MKRKPLTKKEIKKIELNPFKPKMSYTRYKTGEKVPEGFPGYFPPREKKEWSFEGTHHIELSNGIFEERLGRYITKMTRE